MLLYSKPMLVSIRRVAAIAVFLHRSATTITTAAASFVTSSSIASSTNKTFARASSDPSCSGSSNKMILPLSSGRFVLHGMESIESTQDETRRLLKENSQANEQEHPYFAVTAKEQTKGRGTSGRQWIGSPGNVFLTVAIPMNKVPVTITLLPLKVGTIVATVVSKLLLEQKCTNIDGDSPKVTVKWPNDVLVDQGKISGVLIESELVGEEVWLLVGIGVNIAHAPPVPTDGPNRGRPSTSIQSACGYGKECAETNALSNSSSSSLLRDVDVTNVAVHIASALLDFIQGTDNKESLTKSVLSEKVVEEWEGWAEFGTNQVLRDKVGNEMVVPIGIESDGQLRVRDKDGRERLLIADYLL